MGNISEDILRDSRKFFEHGLPRDSAEGSIIDITKWGRVPRIPNPVNAFGSSPDAREKTDVGLDGLKDNDERTFFKNYLDILASTGVSFECLSKAQMDPANDNFTYFLDEQAFNSSSSLFDRYFSYNGTEGNSPPPQEGDNNVRASTNIPDSEDINNDNTMSENESYFEYVIQLDKDPNGNNDLGNLNPNNPQITDIVNTQNGTWYRFRIPLDEHDRAVGGIADFRSIRFMRMLLTQFDQRTTLRFATLDLVRNQWRRISRNPVCSNDGVVAELFIDAVNIEEHSDRQPFPYDIPLGIQRERITSSTYQDIYQNEQSLSLKFEHLQDGCERRVYKGLDLDLRVYKRLQMFIHAEEADRFDPTLSIPDGAVTTYIRMGSDFDDNYYEYEVPLVQSRNPDAQAGEDYKNELWRPENNVDFSLEDFTNLKIERNAAGIPPNEVYEKQVTVIINGVTVPRTYRIRGNPTLGYVRNVVIGIRNPADSEFISPYYGEVWVNELRLVGLDEKGGVAGLARLDADLADFGNVGLSGAYSSIGWGALDQKLDDRAKESVTQVDFSTGLQLGKLLGPNSKLSLPFYYQYSETVRKPEYDALDLDLPLAEKLRSIADPVERDSVREQSQDLSSLKQISLTNVRKEAGGGRDGGGKVMPWDISNFTASYSYSRSRLRNEVVEKDQVDQHLASLDYGFSLQPKPLQPFKSLSKSIWLKWLTELNLNPIPNSFTFGTVMDRKFGERSYRFSDLIYKTWFDKRFTWTRTYSVRWDLAKSLKLNFNAANASVVDEPNEYVNRQTQELIDPRVRKDSIWNNILDGGRTKDYNQQFRATFNVPLKTIPMVDWVNMNLSYDATYSWRAASINTDSLGNVIQNGQVSQVSTDLDFTKLYNKSKFLAKINKPVGSSASANRPSRAPAKPQPQADPTKPPVDSLNQGGKKQVDKPKEPKKANQEVSPPLKIALRMLMAVRKLKVNYGETAGTTIPGFTPQTGFLGMASGFGAPGLSFVSGVQPQINKREDQKTGDYLDHARTSNWITTNPFQNAPVLQSKTKSLDSRLSIEPFNDFKIDVDMSRNLTSNFSVFYKTYNKTDISIDSIDRKSPREIGSFTMSYLAIPTLFMDDSIQVNQLFDKFERNRAIISEERGDGSIPHDIDGNEYDYGFGRKQQDILIPAFLSAYTNKDPKNFEFTDMFDWIPRPNWTLSYNGLSKLNMFKDIFSNVRISHGYKSSLTINSFESDLNYDDYDETTGDIRQQNPFNVDMISRNYYSQFLLPSIIIEEAFAPLIGIDIKTKNDMNISFAYNKRRSLAMGFISYELAETRSTTYDIGFDWKLKDVRIGFLPGFNSAANKKKSSANKPQGGGGTPKLGNDLNILFDLSFSDNITFNHLLDQDSGARPTRGSKDITISPAISYDVNKNVSLRFFVDYRRQQPYVSNSYLVVNTEGGVTVRIKLE
jgi:cell surface protein SprA